MELRDGKFMPRIDLEDLTRMALAIIFVVLMGVLAAFALGLYLVIALVEVLFGY